MAADLVHVEGIHVQNILVDDDVAVRDSLYTAGGEALALPLWPSKATIWKGWSISATIIILQQSIQQTI
jgi:dihydroxyacetone kinase